MTANVLTIALPSPDETSRLASSLAGELTGGDVLLLIGDVGSGKTHFSRTLIQNALGRAEDVPSPTFTLVQTYALPAVDIWHADLYRLTSTQEIEELGLIDAFETQICLVEWPDRLGQLSPGTALSLTFEMGEGDEERVLTASWQDPRWSDKLRNWQS